jgi:hypothetical protein
MNTTISIGATMSGRRHTTEMLPLEDRLLRGSLDEAAVGIATEATPDYPSLPWVNVIKISDQGLIHRGLAAVDPLLDEIVANLGRHKMILGTGAGPAPDTSTPWPSTWVCRRVY